jgi:hypothetical protein
MPEHICIKECYYGSPGCRIHYKPGDRLRGEVPNKHFVKAQDFDPRQLNPWPENELHDKRSTVKILADLLHKFEIRLDPKTTTRKEAFAIWRKAQDKAMATPIAPGKTKNPLLTRDPC